MGCLFGEWISRKAIDWCRSWTSNGIIPVITSLQLQDGKTERKRQSMFGSSLWIPAERSAFPTGCVGEETGATRGRNPLLSSIAATSYIITCISIQCPTVRQILIKLHHSEEKEWSSLSSGGSNDFIFCLVVWWMMKCWPKNQKWTNKTKQQALLEYPKDSHWRRKKEIDILSTVFVCFCWKSIENMPPHINRRKTLYELFFLEDICQQYCSPETSLCVLFMWRCNICTYFVPSLVFVSILHNIYSIYTRVLWGTGSISSCKAEK